LETDLKKQDDPIPSLDNLLLGANDAVNKALGLNNDEAKKPAKPRFIPVDS